MARGSQPYSSIVIPACDIGGAASAPYNGDCDGGQTGGKGGAAGPWRERPLRSTTCRVLRDLNLSKVGTGCHQGDVCLVCCGLAGQLVRVRVRSRCGGRTRRSHTRAAQVRAWTPHLMCFDNGDRMRKGWAMAGRGRGDTVVGGPSRSLRDDGDCGSGGPAEAVGGLEWTGRWPGARASEISHLHRAGIMTMSSEMDRVAAGKVDGGAKGCWACPMAAAKGSHWQMHA
jgi:hypothetical protein